MSDCEIKIEILDAGFEVSVPDYAEMAKKMAASKKAAGSSTDMAPTPYMGDCCKEYAVTSKAEVLKLVRDALDNAPAGEYETAFAEASAETE